jgi:serine/threonine-protein kinase
LNVDDVIGRRFKLREPLGSGTFGAVWRALDLDTEGQVAIKLLHPHHRSDPRVLGRFGQEARLLVELRHPAIAAAIAWSIDPPEPYLAMELVRGETLGERIADCARRARPIPLRGIAHLADQLAGAVAHAHERGVVHRDLKPKNVMLNHPGARPFLKVLDFGIAKVLVGSELDPTTIGRVLGSVFYLSPEQIRREPVDRGTDVFALGTILFELMTLRRAWAKDESGEPLPFHEPIPAIRANVQFAVLHRIAKEARPSPSSVRPDLPRAVDLVLAKALALDPRDRFATASDLALALRIALLEPSLDPPPTPTISAPDAEDTKEVDPFEIDTLRR